MLSLSAQGVSQSSSLRPGMFWKSAVLWVTRVGLWTRATEAIIRLVRWRGGSSWLPQVR